MKNLIKIISAIFCIIIMMSCNRTQNTKPSTNSAAATTTPSNDVATYTCDDLKAINQILFITFTYNNQYDLDNDGAVTVQDKLIIERDLLKYNAACVTALRTCDDLQAVKDQIQAWADTQSWPALWATTMKAAIAYSIIFNESGQRCANDAGTGSFMGDVNKNGYLDCSEPKAIQQYTVGNPVDNFEPALADVNAGGYVNSTDALIVRIALASLFTNYMDNLGTCP